MLIKKRLSILFTAAFVFLCLNACKNKNIGQAEDSSDVLVQVYEDTDLSLLEDTYKAYELQKVEVVSRPMHIYLFKFNSKKIKEIELVKLLKQSDLVKEAQPNRNVELRN